MCRCSRWPTAGLVVNAHPHEAAGGRRRSDKPLCGQGGAVAVFGDMLGSLGVLVAAGIIILTGWKLADPLIGAGIGLLILPRTWTLLKQAIHILMEGTPPEVDVALLERTLLGIPGVAAVRDRQWTVIPAWTR